MPGGPTSAATCAPSAFIADGGFAEYLALPQKQAFILPASLKPAHGAFCEPLGCCRHGVDLAEIRPGSSVAVPWRRQ
ncbi:hypothetical protein ACFSOZ_19570 [Mesorhizobium newzealandense]|uniref:Uncharacterized protein n=1 Tax=Mesorhizobium newzealandense TaxID=1300302 RepID=A0ABW4UB70_9HYPH